LEIPQSGPGEITRARPDAGRLPGKSSKSRQREIEWRIERCFTKLKQLRHIATRHDRIAHNYPAFAKLAAVRLWPRFYESAA
jgi:hypothetical protein